MIKQVCSIMISGSKFCDERFASFPQKRHLCLKSKTLWVLHILLSLLFVSVSFSIFWLLLSVNGVYLLFRSCNNIVLFKSTYLDDPMTPLDCQNCNIRIVSERIFTYSTHILIVLRGFLHKAHTSIWHLKESVLAWTYTNMHKQDVFPQYYYWYIPM